MKMTITGRKARLYATGIAVSLLAISSAANAQVAGGFNGKYKKGTWSLTKEAAGNPKPGPVLTAEQQAVADAEAYKKTTTTSLLLGQRNANTVNTYNSYTAAITAEKTAVTNAATAAKALTTAETAKADADALAASLLTRKTAAGATATTATAAYNAALTAYNALPNTATAAERAAAMAVLDKAWVDADRAAAESNMLNAHYTAAQSGASTALTNYTNAITAKASADAAVLTAQATKTTTGSAFDTALAADTNFLGVLAAVNQSAGTSFAATYDGLVAVAAYDDAPAAEKYASNGFTRATTTLTAAAASSNASIAMASGALTGSAAALEAGANYETEVLGVLVDHEGRLVDHEGRIVANTTAITAETAARIAADTALDVRTTANTTAITAETAARIAADTAEANARIAEDKRLGGLISAESSARMAQNQELRDRISSSTATAIALGGVALLPDMGFTLSGNVGFYEGAQAMALTAAAKVGPNAYLTAAAGGGLNKKGSLGGRVGFVLGF